MRTTHPRITIAATAVAALAALSACSSNGASTGATGSGSSGSGGSGGGASGKVAFLMPDEASTRYDQHDHPGFVTQMTKDCPKCSVLYNNANGDAAKQQQQFNSALTQGAKVVVLDPVDSSAAASLVQQAHSRGVKVIAYDRPITATQADYYVSFDNEKIGALISKSLVDHLKAVNAPTTGGLLEVNGSPTDAAAGLIKKGIHEGLSAGGYKTLAEYDTPEWEPAKAQDWVSGQVSRFHTQIVGVVAANDGTAGGTIAAFKAANVSQVPPVTGNDATTAGLQQIIAGDLYNTISKPSEIVAAAAADAAVQLLQGKKPTAESTVFNTPSKLFTPMVITKENIKAEILDKGIAKAADLCTAAYQAACAKLNIS